MLSRNLFLLTPLMLSFVSPMSAQNVDQIISAEGNRIEQGQESQDSIDVVVDATSGIIEQYRAVTKEVDGLVVYNTLLQRQIDDQNETLRQMRESIDNVQFVERQILPLLTRMITGLEQFVSLDVPFLVEERSSRVTNLTEVLERADVSAAEKFRVVMEAWQIENDYGRTIEAYTDNVDGREVDVLRIGRVALLYQTPDGQTSGSWDKDLNQWVEVDNGFRTAIRNGIRLARNQIGPDLLLLPIAAPKEG
jgi:hypothetical protein